MRQVNPPFSLEEMESRVNPGALPANPIGAVAGPGLGTVTVVNFGTKGANVNDDNTVGWPKTHFSSHDLTYAKQAYIDREYLVEDTNGTTEFNFEDNIINGTDQDWPGISITLGMDLGKNFFPLAVGTLDMDWPDADSGPATPGFTKDHTTYAITWKDDVIPAGKSRVFFYSVDIPDWDPEAMPDADIEGGYIFTIRAEPLVAEGKGEGLMFGGRRVDMTKSPFADRDQVVLPPPVIVAGQPRLVLPTLSPSDINIPHPSLATDTGGTAQQPQGQKSGDAITFTVDDRMVLDI
jgi:hypothetical protein